MRPEWALVLGGASCVWDDVRAWEHEYGQPWDGLVIAANDIGIHWPGPLHHWASLHSEVLHWQWQPQRTARQASPADSPETWGRPERFTGCGSRQLVDHVIQPWGDGSSGMLATQVAHEVGCVKAVLCGIPMTKTAHFAETTEKFADQWHAANGHWRAWKRHKHLFLGWARSMSGRTRELLGTPTREWIVQG